MLDAGALASYIGFTDDEVKQLCKKYDRDYEAVSYSDFAIRLAVKRFQIS